jgi:NtrC-family two-component system response regulator AlgB
MRFKSSTAWWDAAGNGSCLASPVAARPASSMLSVEIELTICASANYRLRRAKFAQSATRTKNRAMNILVIDDDSNLRKSLRLALETMNHQVTEASDGDRARECLAHGMFEVAFLDLRLSQERGLDVLPTLLRLAPGLAVVVVTAYATIETAVEAMRRGASDYLPKPFTPNEIRVVLDRVVRFRRLETHVEELEAQVRSIVPEVDLQTEEPEFRQTLEIAFKAAPTEATILLRGESGTGKGILARAIHAHSLRSAGPLITVNCPSLSAELLESELFGHVRGAFTGAVKDTVGKVAAAEGGALFLDEIGDLPLGLQPKLLRLLQEKRYERVGETRTRACDVRMIAATNQDLQEAVARGTFREDLLYRLNVIELTLPPLRKRPKDILPMAEHLLRFFKKQTGNKGLLQFTDEARDALMRYPWPGNVRELRNAIERGVILASGSLVGLPELPAQIGATRPTVIMEIGGAVTLEALEGEHIRRVLASTSSLDEAASLLGIDPSTLYRKRKRFGL